MCCSGDFWKCPPAQYNAFVAEDVEKGYAIACQTVIEGDLSVVVPPQEKIQQRLTTGQSAADVSVPEGYDYVGINLFNEFL